MIGIILTATLLIGLVGMIVMLLRKAPLLTALPESSQPLADILSSKIKESSRNIPGVRSFSYELYLQKLLSKVRVFSLKTDHKTSSLLEKLRQRSSSKSSLSGDSYWEELKKAKDGK